MVKIFGLKKLLIMGSVQQGGFILPSVAKCLGSD